MGSRFSGISLAAPKLSCGEDIRGGREGPEPRRSQAEGPAGGAPTRIRTLPPMPVSVPMVYDRLLPVLVLIPFRQRQTQLTQGGEVAGDAAAQLAVAEEPGENLPVRHIADFIVPRE